MLKTFRGAWLANVQFQQIRLEHRIRGKAPIYCRTIKERLDELNNNDEVYTTRIDIGMPPAKKTSNLRTERLEHVKKLKNDKNLEQLARNHSLDIDLSEARKDWLKSNSPYHKRQIIEHYGIFEHLYGEGYFIPFINLDIQFKLNDDLFLPVCCGNVIKPSEALEYPTVSYESDGASLWTLALTSLDGHLTEGDKEYVHWLVANIPGDAIEKVNVSSPLKNRTFVTRDWYKQYQDMITPTGLAFFQCDWDDSVKDYFHNTLKMKEPIYEYDFPAPYIRPQEWFPRRKPFNLYMDKYRDPKEINKEYVLRKLKNEDPFKKPPPPLRFPNAHPFPRNMPSWLRLHEKKIRLGWGRVNEI
ncbi:large ribosomal subunit protein mL38 isoform X2 [Amyelois transitella]|uniref:large ribosomal subunit protein mL38 isoform X2 n=1 Tax=Amyelois transitella TaxID=680683 RepID=UPI0029900891|nr:large ribosomal subunit protein mL38 isoform X2 [Amyelois transitella]